MFLYFLIDGVYRHVVQMRGLPFRATEEQVRSFFGLDFEISAVQFEIGADHRPTGRARYVSTDKSSANDIVSPSQRMKMQRKQ